MLKGKIAVVTGGTRGIGYAVVRKYLENGAKVVLFGSREETVDKALNKLKEENPDWEVSGDHPNLSDAKEEITVLMHQYLPELLTQMTSEQLSNNYLHCNGGDRWYAGDGF